MLDKRLVFLLYYYSTLAISVLAIESNLNSNYVSFPAKENGTCYKRVPYNDALAANISKGLIKSVPGSQIQAGVKTSNRAWVTIIDCCDGYTRNPNTGECETYCEEGCFGGICTGPNICTCPNNYRPEAGVCKPICRRACPSHAYCFSPELCSCEYGYEEIDGVCQPVCLHGCRNGDCVAPKDCRCHPGYFLNETQRCEPVCEGGCPHGTCTQPGICTCNWGYVNPPNDQEICIPTCPESCTNGECYSPGICTCKPGYIGLVTGACVPECHDACINGRCVAPEHCECNPGFVMDPQLRRCVEYHAGVSYDYSLKNDSSINNYNYPTISPDVLVNRRSTSRPEILNQIQNSNHTFEGQKHEQQTIMNRNIYESNQTESPLGVIGLQDASRSQNRHKLNNQQETYVPQDFNQKPNSYNNSSFHGIHVNNQTNRQHSLNQKQGTFVNNSFYEKIPSRKLQGPFPPLEPHSLQEQNHTQDLYKNNDFNQKYDYTYNPNPQNIHDYNRTLPSQNLYPIDEMSQMPEARELNNHYQPITTQNPSRISGNHGVNYTQNSHNINNFHGIHDYNQTYQPQGSRVLQGPFPIRIENTTQFPYTTNGTRGIQRTNPEYRTQRPFSPEIENTTQIPYNIHGPYSVQGSNTRPQGPFSAEVRNTTQIPYNLHGPYGVQGSNTRTQGPFPIQLESTTQVPYNVHGPYGIQGSNTRPQGRFPAQAENTPQIPQNIQGPYGVQGSNSRPQGRFPAQVESTTQMPYNIQSPYGIPESNSGYRPQGPFPVQGVSPTSNPYNPQDFYKNQGIKTPHRRPEVNQNPGLIDLSYGLHEMHFIPEPYTPFGNPPLYTPQGVPEPYNRHNYAGKDDFGNPHRQETGMTHRQHEPYDNIYNYAGNDNTGKEYTSVGGANKYGAVCDIPCLNGECIGPNQCKCKSGYGPNPNNPYSNICEPICRGGCLNGVCSAPNLCLCNVGFIKEHGVKGAQRCVPAR